MRQNPHVRICGGPGSATTLVYPTQHRWRRLNSAHLLPLVRAGVTFVDGVQKERNKEEDRKEAA